MKKDPIQNELRELLARLPDAPIASNFTARVMQAVELEELRRLRKWHFNWHSLLPRVAFASAVIFLASGMFEHHELAARRAALAQSVALVAGSPSLPSVEALKNFDAIQRMSRVSPRADDELLALLQ
jgi:anti-sigma factor RsiW